MDGVWLVEYAYPWDGGYFVGAYATEELAREVGANVQAAHTHGEGADAECHVAVKIWLEPIRTDAAWMAEEA